MKQPLVSFIIPVLNGEKYIARCLTSIRNQRFPSEQFEVLVVDNGSTDNTPEIVRDLGFKTEVIPRVSVAALRNHGARMARGNYLAFVDTDVEIMPCWLQEGIAVFENRSIVAAGCFPRAPRPATWVQQAWEIHQCGDPNHRSRRTVSWLPSMNLLVRREAFLRIGGFNQQLVTAEDVDLCYRLGRQGTILCNPAMEAIHWGEAPDLGTFWRKEVWRGMGNLRGVIAHGFRWDELPSVGYPIYILVLLFVISFGFVFDFLNRQFNVTIIGVSLLILPASMLAVNTVRRERQPDALAGLLLLYLIYGVARAYSLVKVCIHQRD